MPRWTKKMTKHGEKCWKRGMSALQTCNEMNRLWGDWLHREDRFTRNAVIGKWNRMGLHRANLAQAKGENERINRKHHGKGFGYANPTKVDPRRTRPGRGMFKDIAVDTYDRDTRLCEFEDLEPRQCHWPVYGDAKLGTLRFCGETVQRGPYCQHHYDRAHQKARGRAG